MEKKNWKIRAAAVILGIVFAFFLEGIIDVYQINRGYGKDRERFPLVPASTIGYVVGGEEGNLWVKTQEESWMTFYPEQGLGHIKIRFQEPLTEEMGIQCLYGRNDIFHVLQRKGEYLLEETKEAVFTIPYGNWNCYRLNISGNFFLESIEGAEVVPLRQIDAEQIFHQIHWGRFVFLLFLFSVSGLLIVQKKENRKKESQKQTRVVYLDAIRAFASFMVIVVHVVGFMEGMCALWERKELYLPFLFCQFLTLSCNPLFFMLSGALLLPWREESFSVFVQKRLLKVILPLFIYGSIYLILLCATKAPLEDWSIAYGLSMLQGTVRMGPHLWMVFELIGMYILVIPFRALLKNASEQTEKLLTMFILVLLGVYSITYYLGIQLVFTTFFAEWAGVFLLGYFMNRGWMRQYDRLWMMGGAAGLFLGVTVSMINGRSTKYVFGTSIFIVMIGCGIFAALLHLEKYLQKIKGILLFCSKYSYSVLLIHWFVLYNIVFIQGLSPLMPKVSFVLLSVVSCTLVSFLLSVLIDHTIIAVLEQGIHQSAKIIRCCMAKKKK